MGLIVALGLAVLRHYLLAESFPLLYDEGIHLMWIRLILAGFTPYTEVYITYPPLYHTFLVWAWNIWPSLEGIRWLTLVYTFPSVVLIALIGQRIAGTPAAIAGSMLFCLAPQFFENSRSVMGELPSVTWSLMAIWLALRYRENGNSLLLGLSGITLACSLLTKMLSPHVIVLIIGIVLSRFLDFSPLPRFREGHRACWRAIVVDLAYWTGAFLACGIALLAAVDWRSLATQVVEQRVAARLISVVEQEYWFDRFELPGLFLNSNLWLLPLAQLGLIESFIHRLNYRFTLVGWFVLAVLMLTFHAPVHLKHMVILLPVMTIWGGIAVGEAWTFLRRRWPASDFERVASALVLAILLAYTIWLPDYLKSWQLGRAVASTGGINEEMLKPMFEFIQEVTTPNDCMVTDNTTAAYLSGLLTPPELAEVSINRLVSGHLSSQQLIDITDRYDCQVVVVGRNRIADYLPEYVIWLARNYLGRAQYGNTTLFFAKHTTSPNPDQEMQVRFGESIEFLGYNLTPTSVDHNGQFALTMFWKAIERPPADFTIFVHLRDSNNTTILTADHQPYKDQVPTSRWVPGGVIKETVWIRLPPDMPPGQYSIWVGLYRLETMERLPIQGDTSGENALQLGELTIPLSNRR